MFRSKYTEERARNNSLVFLSQAGRHEYGEILLDGFRNREARPTLGSGSRSDPDSTLRCPQIPDDQKHRAGLVLPYGAEGRNVALPHGTDGSMNPQGLRIIMG
jgi:hypothetical protein